MMPPTVTPAGPPPPGRADHPNWRFRDAVDRRRAALAILVALAGLFLVLTSLLSVVETWPGRWPDLLPFALRHGAHTVVVAAGFLLLFVARSLFVGRRDAWLAALLLLISTSVVQLLEGINLAVPFAQLAIIGALAWRWRDFGVRPERPTVAGALRAAGLGLISLLTYALIGFVVLTNAFSPRPSVGQRVRELFARIVFSSTRAFEGTTLQSSWFLDSLTALWFGLLLVIIALVLRAVRYRVPDAGGKRDRALALLRQHGSQNIAYMTTWPGNLYMLTTAGDAYVAYRVIGDVALALGDPIGDRAGGERAIAEFLDRCKASGWTPCFYAATARHEAAYRASGLEVLQIAEDTTIDLPGLAFKGKPWQDVRSALNKAEREGLTFEWVDLADGPPAIVDQLAAISARWVADKDLPEVGFTLGTLAEARDPEVRTAVAIDARRTVHGFTTWLPVYEDGQVTGWTIDLMRRREAPQAPPGTMEFLIARAALAFQAEGARTMSLSAAPLAQVAAEGAEGRGLQRALDQLAVWLEPLYGFRSLLAFKEKFQPRREPVYLVYPGVLSLPAISLAIVRAYVPKLSPGEVRALLAEAIHALPHPGLPYPPRPRRALPEDAAASTPGGAESPSS